MGTIKEGFIPSLPRRAWKVCAAAFAWIWIPSRFRRKWIAEGAREERQTLIRTLKHAIEELEKRPGAGKVRHLRYALALVQTRHNRIENIRRDGEGDDQLLGEVDPRDFERVAREGGSLQFKKPSRS